MKAKINNLIMRYENKVMLRSGLPASTPLTQEQISVYKEVIADLRSITGLKG